VKYHIFYFSTSTGRRALLKKTCQNVSSYALNHFESNQIISDQNGSNLNIVYLHIFNKFKMCLTWNRWNIIIFLFLLLQGGGHFWKKKLVKTVGVFEATHWQLLASFRYVQSSWDALLLSHQSKEGFQFFYLPHRTERMDQQHSGPLFYYTVQRPVLCTLI
jgi:hypothetical protein